MMTFVACQPGDCDRTRRSVVEPIKPSQEELETPHTQERDLNREQFAAALRGAQREIGRQIANGLGARWRPDDVGADLTGGVVADECRHLVTALAFAVAMQAPGLFCDEVVWLDRMFQARGYPSARFMPHILDAYERGCCGVAGSAVATAFATPVIDAARRLCAPASGGARAAAAPGAPPDAG